MKAIILNLSAWALLPFMDAIAKYLSSELSFFQITWARYFFTVFWTLPLMYFFFRKNLTFSENPKLQIIRGLTLFSANICFFYSISIISMRLPHVVPLVLQLSRLAKLHVAAQPLQRRHVRALVVALRGVSRELPIERAVAHRERSLQLLLFPLRAGSERIS